MFMFKQKVRVIYICTENVGSVPEQLKREIVHVHTRKPTQSQDTGSEKEQL